VIAILYIVVALIALVLHIMLLVKIFQYGSVVLGILGIICPPFALIWGWLKSEEYEIRNLMVWLTLATMATPALKRASVNADVRPTRERLLENSN
jgi:hypothetical protein